MRKLVIGGALAILVLGFGLVARGESTTLSSADRDVQRMADLYQIDQIEVNFHKATTLKDIDLMVSLWAPNATLTVGPGETAVGLDEIRRFWLEKSTAFQPSTHWVSDHPAYKVEVTVNGDRGTLHFECHYVDYDTNEVALVTVADQDVARIDGRWLITNMVAGSTMLVP
jgi:ketosteroid isomerase-like protein